MPIDSKPQALHQIIRTLNDAGLHNRPVAVDASGKVTKVTGKLTSNKSDHRRIIRSVVWAAAREDIDADIVASFSETIAKGYNQRSRDFAHDVLEASRQLRILEDRLKA